MARQYPLNVYVMNLGLKLGWPDTENQEQDRLESTYTYIIC